MKVYDFIYNKIYTKLPRGVKARISRLVYKPEISKKAIIAGYQEYHVNVKVGDYTSLQDETFLANCEIGKFCALAKGVRFLHTQHKIHSFSQAAWVGMPPFKEKSEMYDNREVENEPGCALYLPKSYIENDVWIGEYVTIKGGVTIGNGAIIGARSVVTHDIPPYAIAVGAPARVIGYRFDENKIQLMQKIQWWNWSEEKIRRNHNRLCSFDMSLGEEVDE